jgi:glycosyltransferase involved in cell wall biosynthesis
MDLLNSEIKLVLNSSINEGMSSSLLEAMKYKVPVLARNNQGSPLYLYVILGNQNLINHLENGYLFNSENDFMKYYNEIFNNLE